MARSGALADTPYHSTANTVALPALSATFSHGGEGDRGRRARVIARFQPCPSS